MNEIELSDVIVNLRKELLEAQRKGAEEKVKFTVEDIEVELQVTTSINGDGGIKFGVVNVGAGVSSSSTHKIKLKLKPSGDDGKELKISDQVDNKPK